ncbi:hypothetical protein BHM03_00025625 [Ensete ventricosum]|nr:hypothetical protein BHM03_00025625 [Ensete ventricosum]
MRRGTAPRAIADRPMFSPFTASRPLDVDRTDNDAVRQLCDPPDIPSQLARFPYHEELSAVFSGKPAGSVAEAGQRGFDPQAVSTPFESFTDLLCGTPTDDGSLAGAFGFSCLAPADGVGSDGAALPELMAYGNNDFSCSLTSTSWCGGGATPVTPNSSASSSSTEAAGEEDGARRNKDQLKREEEVEPQQVKGEEDGDDMSNKV